MNGVLLNSILLAGTTQTRIILNALAARKSPVPVTVPHPHTRVGRFGFTLDAI